MTIACDFAILGPTASGKTALAVELARADRSIELLSIDAFACYRRLDLGTAKPDPAARAAVRWHLLDLVDPDGEFSVAEFAAAAAVARAGIADRGGRAGLVGGSGLYLRAVVDGLQPPPRYDAVRAELEELADAPDGVAALHRRLADLDPLAASRMEPSNRRRIVRALEVTLGAGKAFSSFGPGLEVYASTPVAQIGLALERAELDLRIARRFAEQLDAGFLDEVRALLEEGVALSRTAEHAIGYRELALVIEGRVDLAEATTEVLRRTRNLARRQLAWLRRDPRIVWVDANAPDIAAHVGALVGVGNGAPNTETASASFSGRPGPV